ncbi:rod-binding protein [Pseudoprimorskyibacter insulae]|uniref:Peptidoglycan hydrolase FlgJ n=1 Tax=Pseudoprimorskyibacter insulae TaxID=1695997 RepID=A0A2R8AW07_9RHOB|nr:rod-binding protein [Pseudoprimorskyibacter insulae]SPF80107.1 Peptidoglycan hydrolase FlgJ [Pseudoprimorskyibacter insulae]
MTQLPTIGGAMPLTRQLTGDAAEARQDDRLRQAADGFEALFLQQMLKSAREASLGDDLFGSSAQDTTNSLLDQELANTASGNAGFGLSDAVYRQFSGFVGKRG